LRRVGLASKLSPRRAWVCSAGLCPCALRSRSAPKGSTRITGEINSANSSRLSEQPRRVG
jgi:hypothetical protein